MDNAAKLNGFHFATRFFSVSRINGDFSLQALGRELYWQGGEGWRLSKVQRVSRHPLA